MKKIGRYEIVEELGRGAMGVVYKASDPTIGRLVALKVLSLASSSEPGVPGPQDIFMREARAAGRLAHPAIVTIHDAFEDPESKSSCIVMELVPGRTLEKVLLSGSKFSVEETLEIIRQVAEGLDYAHRHEVIHRDLKPANILLSEDGRAKLTDFGIAKILAREGAARTATLMGTPSYMSPEQVTAKEIDARSDLFSLGIILYLMLTGQKPFAGDTAAVMYKIVFEDPVLPRTLNPKLQPGHDYLILRLLAKDRDKRYASARQFLDDLDDVRNGRAPRSEATAPAAELVAGERTIIAPAPPVSPPEPAPLPPKRKVNWLAAGTAALVILGIALVVGLWKFRPAKTPPPPRAQATAQPSVAPRETPAPQTPTPAPRVSPSSQKSPSAPPAGKQAAGLPKQKGVATKASGTVQAQGVTATPRAPLATTSPATATPSTAAPAPAPANPAPAPSRIQLACRHELKDGKLSVSTGAQEILQAVLKGKKKGGLLGIKGSYEGFLSRSLTVPPGTRDLTVHVSSSDGAVDMSNTISLTPPAGSSPVLQVVVKRDQILLNWQTPAAPKP